VHLIRFKQDIDNSSYMVFALMLLPSSRTFWTHVFYPDDEALKEAVLRDRHKISILVELTVCRKNIANALNSGRIVLKNKVQFVTFPFFFIVKLQNFLNAPRSYLGLVISPGVQWLREAFQPLPYHSVTQQYHRNRECFNIFMLKTNVRRHCYISSWHLFVIISSRA